MGLRTDDVMCGTSTTGTGTLTLAACPEPPGGLDFDKWLKATGYGFSSGSVLIVSYEIVEYTDATFTKRKQREGGFGTLTLGASISAATLARTLVGSTVTGMDTSTPSPTFVGATAIAIGTAANTLVFVGVSAMDIIALEPFIEGTQNLNGNTALSVAGQLNPGAFTLTSDQDVYSCFIWPYTMLVKRATLYIDGTYTGQNNNVYVRLYAIGTDGRPGKLLCDFGQIGTLNASLAATGAVVTGALANGFPLTPGEYYINIGYHATPGGTGTPQIHTWASPIISGRTGSQGAGVNTMWYVNGTVSGIPNDPAALSGLGSGSNTFIPWFAFKPA